jgi:hypothetical protein
MMPERKRRPARGGAVQLGGERHPDTTEESRVQFLARLGLPLGRAAIVAGLAFGEARL